MLRIAAFALLAIAAILMWFVLPDIYRGAAETPNELTGQVIAINDHGNVVYVTQSENIARIAALPLVFATLVVGALYFEVEHRKRATRE